jgi:polar amino acid transport system substrate-binding protein
MRNAPWLKKLAFLTIILFSLLGHSTNAFADENIYCGDKTIRVGMFKLGYRYYVEDGKEKGMNVDILQEFRKRTNCKMVSQEMTFARIWEDLAKGELDMSLSGIWSKERDATLWTAPSIASKNYVIVGKNALSTVKNSDDFLTNDKLVFGVVRGYTHGKELDVYLSKLREKNRVEESSNVDILFEKIKSGHVDAIFSFPFVYRKLLSELNIGESTLVQDWFPEDNGIIGCTMLAKSTFSEAESNKWKELSRQMQSDGTLKSIFMRYVSPEEAEKMLSF